jgi:hypothetical protein
MKSKQWRATIIRPITPITTILHPQTRRETRTKTAAGFLA